MTVEKEHRRDGVHSLTLRGLVHEVNVMTRRSDYEPLSLRIKRGIDSMVCLLDQDDINALAKFFAEYAEPDDEGEQT